MRQRPLDFKAIELLVLDVDGVLTDGGLIIHSDGSESKQFHTLDGYGIHLWHRAGGKVALLSGRFSPPVERRARELHIEHVLQDCHCKLAALEQLLRNTGLKDQNVAYMGDDLMDLPPMRRAGLGVAVANAVDDLKVHADYVTVREGGHGAVREVIEYILRNSGRWDDLVCRPPA
jgi:3-deoxy-D-manno-octulosonate 8-phosphate phosphatase (KDO 8-P phosphatase)